MKNEEKELLLKDLCERLPYGVNVLDDMGRVYKLQLGNAYLTDLFYGNGDYVEAPIRPFLRPMSSMTKEEKAIYSNYKIVVRGLGIVFEYNLDFVTEWLLKHHFDYRGLIGKGLAIEAPEDMYEN